MKISRERKVVLILTIRVIFKTDIVRIVMYFSGNNVGEYSHTSKITKTKILFPFWHEVPYRKNWTKRTSLLSWRWWIRSCPFAFSYPNLYWLNYFLYWSVNECEKLTNKYKCWCNSRWVWKKIYFLLPVQCTNIIVSIQKPIVVVDEMHISILCSDQINRE